jgi:hypothetical protein
MKKGKGSTSPERDRSKKKEGRRDGKRKENGPERKDERKQESRVGYGTHASRIATHHEKSKMTEDPYILCTPEETRQDG